jgi:hypothetical protein
MALSTLAHTKFKDFRSENLLSRVRIQPATEKFCNITLIKFTTTNQLF